MKTSSGWRKYFKLSLALYLVYITKWGFLVRSSSHFSVELFHVLLEVSAVFVLLLATVPTSSPEGFGAC